MTIPTDDGKPDVEFLKLHFSRERQIKEEHALYIIDKATALLRAEPNVLTIDGDAPVIGAHAIASFILLFVLIDSCSLR